MKKSIPQILLILGILIPQISLAALDVKFSNQLMVFINGQRVNHDLPKMFPSPDLRVSTTNKVQDMRANDYFAHLSPSGKQFHNFITELNHPYSRASEILASNYSNEQAFIEAWMKSPSHKDAILGDYEDFSCSYIEPLAVCHFTKRLEKPEPEYTPRIDLMQEIVRIMMLLQELMTRLINLRG